MEQILNDLSPAIQKLAEIFCTSTEYVQEHLMDYVLMYGRYELFENIISVTLATFIISLLGALLVLTNMCIVSDNFETAQKRKELTEKTLKYTIIIVIILVLGAAIYEPIKYFISPEMYGIEQVMRLLRG